LVFVIKFNDVEFLMNFLLVVCSFEGLTDGTDCMHAWLSFLGVVVGFVPAAEFALERSPSIEFDHVGLNLLADLGFVLVVLFVEYVSEVMPFVLVELSNHSYTYSLSCSLQSWMKRPVDGWLLLRGMGHTIFLGASVSCRVSSLSFRRPRLGIVDDETALCGLKLTLRMTLTLCFWNSWLMMALVSW
jgi:hypothetical protein